MARKRIEVSKDLLLDALKNNASALSASAAVGLKFSTFKRKCLELGIYEKNQGRKHFPRDHDTPLEAMVNIASVKRAAIRRGVFEEKCAICDLPPIWLGKRLVLQLDHINGKRADNRPENLRLLCPNCHTQTITWGKRKEHADMAELVDATG